jgi:hypothetical protein
MTWWLWLLLIGAAWAVLEVGFLAGVRLGKRIGYESGLSDGWKQIDAW